MSGKGLIEYLHNHEEYEEKYKPLTEDKLKTLMKDIFTTTGNETIIIPKDDYKDYIKLWNKLLE
jgi:hypothetical protein